MAENSAISWTDHTFNPWIGCTRISPACDGCYAAGLMGVAGRFGPPRALWGGPGKGEGTRSRTAEGRRRCAVTEPPRDLPPAGCVEVRLIVPDDYSGSITISATRNQAPGIETERPTAISSQSPEGNEG